jgi:hypothetical protein
MTRYCVALIAVGGLLLQGQAALAQTSLQVLQQELDDVKQQHNDATAENLSKFFSQVDAAMASSDAAVALYTAAGGTLPPPTPVTTVHESESASEKETRLARDAANLTALGGMLELHCGVMHYGALFVTDSNRKGLQDDFNAWLQQAAKAYPLIVSNAPTSDSSGAGDSNGGHHHRNGGGAQGPPFNLNDLKGKAMRDSVISKYLGFKSWGDKEQGGWAVKDIPKLFRANILEPLRATPSEATLAAWDVYIAMANADEPDGDKWTSTDYPPLQFDRACDDYAISPSTEKLEGILQIIKANPTHPQSEDWLTRAKKLLDDYSTKHGGKPAVVENTAPAPTVPATNSNVTVTTVQQGDATIITTHTNAAPNAPAQ